MKTERDGERERKRHREREKLREDARHRGRVRRSQKMKAPKTIDTSACKVCLIYHGP